MSHYYGTVEAPRGGSQPASRCGHKSTGIRASARSYTGSITVEMFHEKGEDFYEIRVQEGSGTSGHVVASGRVKDLVTCRYSVPGLLLHMAQLAFDDERGVGVWLP